MENTHTLLIISIKTIIMPEINVYQKMMWGISVFFFAKIYESVLLKMITYSPTNLV